MMQVFHSSTTRQTFIFKIINKLVKACNMSNFSITKYLCSFNKTKLNNLSENENRLKNSEASDKTNSDSGDDSTDSREICDPSVQSPSVTFKSESSVRRNLKSSKTYRRSFNTLSGKKPLKLEEEIIYPSYPRSRSSTRSSHLSAISGDMGQQSEMGATTKPKTNVRNLSQSTSLSNINSNPTHLTYRSKSCYQTLSSSRLEARLLSFDNQQFMVLERQSFPNRQNFHKNVAKRRFSNPV